MADFLSIISSGNSPKAVTAGFQAYTGDLGYEIAPVAFQYYPERITDSRSPNYSQKDIPGSSHPLYQFVSGGERVISFDAIFTNDDSGDTTNSVGGVLGGIAGFLGGESTNDEIDSDSRKDVVDISAAIDELREYTYPVYEQRVAKPPPLIVFYLPKSGILSAEGDRDSIVGVLTRCDVAYEGFHRNGRPRIAIVSLEIREVVQTKSNWTYAGWNGFVEKEVVKVGRYNRSYIGE